MTELPDDAAKRFVEAASKIDILPEMLSRVPAAVERVNALRRTWIANGNMHEDSQTNEDLGVVTIAATWAENGLIAARVRAEAVADERQRIKDEVSAPAFTRSLWSVLRGSITAGDSIESIAECVVEEICSLAVAGSVPVATPPAAERDSSYPHAADGLPHSWSCSNLVHSHGPQCAVNCPSCIAGHGGAGSGRVGKPAGEVQP